MADTNTRVQGPVEITDNSAERVAFDLMKWIAKGTPEQQDEILELYSRCLLHVQIQGQTVDGAKARVKKS